MKNCLLVMGAQTVVRQSERCVLQILGRHLHYTSGVVRGDHISLLEQVRCHGVTVDPFTRSSSGNLDPVERGSYRVGSRGWVGEPGFNFQQI